MVTIAVLGNGTVGSGVLAVLKENKALIEKRTRDEIQVKYVLDIRDFPGDPAEKLIVKDYGVILNDASVQIVVEAMGGLEPAYTFIKSALQKGKHVCTSNKELVAAHGTELIATAKANRVNFLFEASVGGGIPILRPLYSSMASDEVYEIEGILNGTTNFILTKMKKENMDFAAALKLAQEKGYAESNPDADVKGFDACRKIAILSSLAYDKSADYADIYTEGIENVTTKDMAYAAKMGGALKLLGYSKKEGGRVYARVSPVILPKSHPLAAVEDVFNAILVKGKTTGDVMFYGQGAGKLPTASAVMADIIDCILHPDENTAYGWPDEKLEIAPPGQSPAKCLLRVSYSHKENAAAQAKEIFGSCVIIDLDEEDGEIGVITGVMTEEALEEKAAAFGDKLLGKMRIDITSGW